MWCYQFTIHDPSSKHMPMSMPISCNMHLTCMDASCTCLYCNTAYYVHLLCDKLVWGAQLPWNRKLYQGKNWGMVDIPPVYFGKYRWTFILEKVCIILSVSILALKNTNIIYYFLHQHIKPTFITSLVILKSQFFEGLRFESRHGWNWHKFPSLTTNSSFCISSWSISCSSAAILLTPKSCGSKTRWGTCQ